MQSKKMSLYEAVINTASGFIISMWLINIILPYFGFDVKLEQSFIIVLVFTIASIVRSYIIRRIFNAIKGGKI